VTGDGKELILVTGDNVQTVSQAVRYVYTHHPRVQVRARPFYILLVNQGTADGKENYK